MKNNESISFNKSDFQKRQHKNLNYNLNLKFTLDRRGCQRFSRPKDIKLILNLKKSFPEATALYDVSATGFSFSSNLIGNQRLKNTLPAEIHLGTKIVFKGTIRIIWIKTDVDSPQKYGASIISTDSTFDLLSVIDSWHKKHIQNSSGRRIKVRRQTNLRITDDLFGKNKSRKIIRRTANRVATSAMDRRVVIVGAGIIAPNAIGLNEFEYALKSGKSGIKKLTSIDSSPFPCKYAGEIKNFNFINEPSIKPSRLDRGTKLALYSVQDALRQSGVNLARFNKYRVGTIFGTTVGGLKWAIEEALKFEKKGYRVMNPYGIAAASPNACSSEITAEYRIKGPSITFSQGCSSSAIAIGHGFDLIKSGKVDCAIVGGADAPLIPSLFGAFCRSGFLTSMESENGQYVPKPYDNNSTGTILSEGAGSLILEDLDSAIAMGHEILAELASYSSLTDGHSMMDHEGTGFEREQAIRFALESSNVNLDKVSLIFGHGIGIKMNDTAEYNALKRIFRTDLKDIPISNIKSMIGYTQGASSAIDSISACLSIRGSFIPPVLNTDNPYPGINISQITRNRICNENVLVNSFGFGGKNVCLVFKKYH